MDTDDEQQMEEFKEHQRHRRAILENLLVRVESREKPGELDEAIEALLKALTAPDARKNIELLAEFARTSRYVRSIWMWLTGGVMAIGAIAMGGRDIAIWLRDFLDHMLSAHPQH